jgi:hypothetical protein
VNLHKAQLTVTPSNDKPLDLPGLVRLLEDEAGFAPITEVEVGLRGRVTRRDRRLTLEVSKTGQSFEISKKTEGQTPAEGESIEARGTLEDVHSGKRLKLLEWKAAPPAASRP